MALSIPEIIENVRIELARNNSPLANFNPFSNVGAIITSIATVINSQDNVLDEIYASLFLDTTANVSLDNRGLDFGLTRLEGRRATGSILLTNLTRDLPAGTILTDPSTRNQYTVLSNISASNLGAEVIGVIEANAAGAQYNAAPGTRLVSSLYPSVSIAVGRQRSNVTNAIEGSLTNGINRESDEEFRFRIRQFVRTQGQATPQSITNFIDGISGTGRIFLVEHVPITGYFTVFIESRDAKVMEEVERSLDLVKPAGVVGLVKSLEQRNIDITAIITVGDTLEISRIRQDLRAELTQYMTGLTIADTVSIGSISRVINNVDGVFSSVLSFPSSNIILKDNELPVLGQLTLRFVVS